MDKFIIDTFKLTISMEVIKQSMKAEYLLTSLWAAHNGKELQPWLTPYEEKKKRGMDGTGAYSDLFNVFWQTYPTRNGKKEGKRLAFKAWCKQANDVGEQLLYDICMKSLEWQVLDEDWRKDKGMFIPMASTYLNGERFQDERPEGTPAGKKMIKNSEGIMVEVDI